jgi:hypothetical protein
MTSSDQLYHPRRHTPLDCSRPTREVLRRRPAKRASENARVDPDFMPEQQSRGSQGGDAWTERQALAEIGEGSGQEGEAPRATRAAWRKPRTARLKFWSQVGLLALQSRGVKRQQLEGTAVSLMMTARNVNNRRGRPKR